MLASPPLVWIGLISYPLYLWHWPLLVFFGIIKFSPLTLLERELILAASIVLAWATYRFVEIPFRFGVPSRRKMFSLGAGMAMVAAAGIVVVWGTRLRFPAAGGNPRHGQCADAERANGGFTSACSISAARRRSRKTASIAIAGRWFWSGAIRPRRR